MVRPAVVCRFDAHVTAIWIFTRKVEQVHPREDGEEATKKGDCVNGIGGVEAAKQDERSDKSKRGECHVIERVHSASQGRQYRGSKWRCEEVLHVGVKLAQSLVEVVHLRENADYNNNGKDIG